MNEMLSEMDFSEKFARFIELQRIKAKLMHFEKPCHSVSEAAYAANASETDFIKSICFISEKKSFFVAIVKGEDRVDKKSISDFFKIDKIRIAVPLEVLEKTGYPVGGVPPFGYDANFVIDKRVLEKEKVFGGGGSGYSLIWVSPTEIIKVNGGQVADIRKK